MKNYLLIFMLLIIASGLKAQEELIANLQRKLDLIVKEEGVPGATLAVVLPNEKLINLASGFSDREAKIAMEPGARMLAGSVGKIFVSALILKVMKEKEIALDSTVSGWFTEEEWFSRIPNADQLTIRMLMNHTSGIPRYILEPEFLQMVKQQPQKRWTPEERLSFIFDKKPTHPAGQGWGYSDTNYIILGILIEKWTRDTYYNQLRRRLMGQTGLKDTRPSYKSQMEGITQAYVEATNFFDLPTKLITNGRYPINPQFEWTGGGLLSNSVDLARFLKAIHEKKLIPAEYYAEMIKAVDRKTGQPSKQGYGLGTFVWETDHGLHYGHLGFMPGYVTAVEYAKDHKVSIALQYNSDKTLGANQHKYITELSNMIIRSLKK